MEPREPKPRPPAEPAKDILITLRDGFDEEQQTLIVHGEEVSLAIPNAGRCRVSEVQPIPEYPGSYYVELRWEGTEFYFRATIDENRNLFVQMKTDRGETPPSTVPLRNGEQPVDAFVRSLKNFMETPWIVDRSDVAEA